MRNGMRSLHQDSLQKVYDGDSTMMEALSNVPPDMITADSEVEDEADSEAAG